MPKQKALILNGMSQAMCIVGGILGYVFSTVSSGSIYLLPISAGGFIYIASSDLIPELHKQPDRMKSGLSLIIFILGICFLLILKLIAH